MASTEKVDFNRSKLTREKDKTVSFSSDTLSTSEKLAIAEAKLSKRAVTSTGQIRTRERLAIAERKLADARVKATSTKTREKYLAAEKELADQGITRKTIWRACGEDKSKFQVKTV